MRKKILASILCVAMSTMLFAGCGNSETVKEETDEVTTVSDDSSYPITIEDYFGETTIESKPERIVTLGWENQDTPLALGVVPVGCSAANYGKVTDNNLHTWTDEAFAALGVDEPVVFNDVDGFDYEAIADCEPDVILAAYSGMTEEEYNLLSEIAPVVTYQTAAWQTTWKEQCILNAEGMGMKEEGEAKVAEVEALIEEKLVEYPDLAGANTAFFWISPDDFSTFYAYLPTDPRANFLLDLGLETPQSILDMAAATTPSILSIPACIDEYLAMLNEANEKIQ